MATPQLVFQRVSRLGTDTRLKALAIELNGLGDIQSILVGLPIDTVGSLITILLHAAAALESGYDGNLNDSVAGPRIPIRPKLAVAKHKVEPLVALIADVGGVQLALEIPQDSARYIGEALIRVADEIGGHGSAVH
jgi:hypothetical protein